MKKRLILLVSILLSTMALATTYPSTARAFDIFSGCTDASCSVVKDTKGADVRAKGLILSAIMVLGGVSVIMIIVGGIRMAAAQGDPGNVKAGKQTIMWSVVGVAVAMFSYTIINFVVGWGWLG